MVTGILPILLQVECAMQPKPACTCMFPGGGSRWCVGLSGAGVGQPSLSVTESLGPPPVVYPQRLQLLSTADL